MAEEAEDEMVTSVAMGEISEELITFMNSLEYGGTRWERRICVACKVAVAVEVRNAKSETSIYFDFKCPPCIKVYARYEKRKAEELRRAKKAEEEKAKADAAKAAAAKAREEAAAAKAARVAAAAERAAEARARALLAEANTSEDDAADEAEAAAAAAADAARVSPKSPTLPPPPPPPPTQHQQKPVSRTSRRRLKLKARKEAAARVPVSDDAVKPPPQEQQEEERAKQEASQQPKQCDGLQRDPHGSFRCPVCPIVHPLAERIVDHLVLHRSSLATFDEKQRMRITSSVAGGRCINLPQFNNLVTCTICQTMLAPPEMAAHRAVHEVHGTNMGKFMCDVCGRRCPTRTHLRAHRNASHREDHPFQCERCGDHFVNKLLFDAHYLLKHRQEDLRLNYRCTECHELFPDAMPHHCLPKTRYELSAQCVPCHEYFRSPADRAYHQVYCAKAQAWLAHRRAQLPPPLPEGTPPTTYAELQRDMARMRIMTRFEEAARNASAPLGKVPSDSEDSSSVDDNSSPPSHPRIRVRDIRELQKEVLDVLDHQQAIEHRPEYTLANTPLLPTPTRPPLLPLPTPTQPPLLPLPTPAQPPLLQLLAAAATEELEKESVVVVEKETPPLTVTKVIVVSEPDDEDEDYVDVEDDKIDEEAEPDAEEEIIVAQPATRQYVKREVYKRFFERLMRTSAARRRRIRRKAGLPASSQVVTYNVARRLHRTTCSKCARDFKTTAALYMHCVRQNAADSVVKCDRCERQVSCVMSHLQLHTRSGTATTIYACTECKRKSFRTPRAYERHWATHLVDVKYACPCCPMRCFAQWMLDEHVQTHGRQAYSTWRNRFELFASYAHPHCFPQLEDAAGAEVRCADCGKVFEDRAKRDEHRLVHVKYERHAMMARLHSEQAAVHSEQAAEAARALNTD